MPETRGDSFITLLDVGRHPGGVMLYYYVEDLHETGRRVTLAAYDTATGQAVFMQVDSLAAIPPGAGAPTRFLETDMEGRVRMRPLP